MIEKERKKQIITAFISFCSGVITALSIVAFHGITQGIY